jgi:hypothetical protein
MHRIQTGVTATTLLVALIGAVSAEAERPETLGRFLLSMPARTLDPMIEHCSESVPGLREALMKERAEFVAGSTKQASH